MILLPIFMLAAQTASEAIKQGAPSGQAVTWTAVAMAIVANDTGEFVEGAATAIKQPITVADCAKYDTFEELVAALEVANSGCTIRSGMAFAKKTVGEIATLCTV